ncbi:MAG: hypothetical protein IIZ67_00830 [Bacilli bacterium]|nr:hypothetical protein [Bacilli bacterium]
MDKQELKRLLRLSRDKNKKKSPVDIKWIITIVFVSFSISFIFSLISQKLMPSLNVVFGIIITLLFIGIGILFDIVGVSVTGADESVFHSMSSKKVRGASVAVKFKKNADKVSSFLCDVIGDICGIISGACGTIITTSISTNFHFDLLFTGLSVAAIIAALTIGGKAIGKSFAVNNSNEILYNFAKVISYFNNG